jgi:hypothetical protein
MMAEVSWCAIAVVLRMFRAENAVLAAREWPYNKTGVRRAKEIVQ